jgi:hypothetical protein
MRRSRPPERVAAPWRRTPRWALLIRTFSTWSLFKLAEFLMAEEVVGGISHEWPAAAGEIPSL